jgi:hypothetical protein
MTAPTGFSGSPRLLKGGIALVDVDSQRVVKIIALQYNPDTVTRTLQIQSISGETTDRSEALRLKGPPIETYKVDIEIDATDQLEKPGDNPTAAQSGIFPQLSALETIIYPPSSLLFTNNTLAQAGTLEIAPMESLLVLFIWSASRIVPVRFTDLSITEEAFDTSLNPIRAKVSLGMRVLSVLDLGFDHPGGRLYMTYQQQKERFAAAVASAGLGIFGITGGIPGLS